MIGGGGFKTKVSYLLQGSSSAIVKGATERERAAAFHWTCTTYHHPPGGPETWTPLVCGGGVGVLSLISVSLQIPPFLLFYSSSTLDPIYSVRLLISFSPAHSTNMSASPPAVHEILPLGEDAPFIEVPITMCGCQHVLLPPVTSKFWST